MTKFLNTFLQAIVLLILTTFVPFNAMVAQAITWTYYDLSNKPINNPTDDEIKTMAIMRVSDTGVTQYALEIDHDFSGTWGTGYLENIGNPSPAVGKQWVNMDEEVICNVDGIVQDVYNINSRYVSTGYYAQGPPNSQDKANALIFDGTDDYVQTTNIYINSPSSISFEFWAKRDRTQITEYILNHSKDFQIGFNSNDMAVFKTLHGSVTASKATFTGWHHWKFVYQTYRYNYHNTSDMGVKLYIYRDDVLLAQKTIQPDCWKQSHPYQTKEYEEGCYERSSSVTGTPGENHNKDWYKCKNEWGYSSDYASKIKGGHPIQICADYDGNECDQCYKKGSWQSKSFCFKHWTPKGPFIHKDKFGDKRLKFNMYDAYDMIKKKSKYVWHTRYSYHCNAKKYKINSPIIFGKGYASNYFKGKLKDVIFRTNNRIHGKWYFNDGDQSNVAKDSSYQKRDASLINFDTEKCWMVDPTLSRYYTFDRIQARQSIPKFIMKSYGKIVYDWGRQHAVTTNTFPENLSDMTMINVLSDESQSNYTGAGSYWYNHGSALKISSGENACQKLSGYRDNTIDPNITINASYAEIQSLVSPQNFSWVYTPYVFEETVILGSPVLLSTVPPDVREHLDLSLKPQYISQDIEESDMVFWSESEQKIYPLRGGLTFDLEYDLKDAECEGINVVVRVTTLWPKSPHIIHIANSPPVSLDPAMDDDVVFKAIKQVEADAAVSGKKFSAAEKGRSVLHFMRNTIDNTIPGEISLSFNGKGFAETEKIGLPANFTIEFHAKRNTIGDLNVAIGHGDPEAAKGMVIGFNENDQFTFDISGYTLTTSKPYTDYNWHHWACVYETDISQMPEEVDPETVPEVSNDSESADLTDTTLTTTFTCKNNPDNGACKWVDDACYTIGFTGDYDIDEKGQRYWNHLAIAHRQCGENITYKRRIYCDGELVGSTETDLAYRGQGALRIGSNGAGWDSSASGFKGQLDDIRIWNVARTQEQIAENAIKRITGTENDLAAYFRMDRIGSAYLDDNRENPSRPIIAVLTHMDPSNSWIVDTTKQFSLEPEHIMNSGQACIRVVETLMESHNKVEGTAFVGHEITGAAYHDSRVPHNGYVFYDKVTYNASIYDRENLQGPIYPVNIKHPAFDARNTILVIWYKVQDGVSWPYQPVEYKNQWLEFEKRIVIASRLGSDGKDENGNDQLFPDINDIEQNYLDPARYQEIQIYNQPDQSLPGYNPNEEHAVVTSSFRNSQASPCPKAAFALRNDLNKTIVEHDDYTSHPYVLIQYFDTVLGHHGMMPFKVEVDDSSYGYTFRYDMKAGDAVVAPYPLNEVIGATPPEEIFGRNSNPDQRCYFKDHKGQSWAISGAGHPLEIAEISVSSSYTDHVDYQIKLAAHTMNYNDSYLIKVIDHRGFKGMMNFTVGVQKADMNQSGVYVNGQEISHLGTNSFIVSLRTETTDLQASHFKLFHYESAANITVYYWYPLQPSFWYDTDTLGDGTGNVGLSIPWLPAGDVAENDGFPEDMIGRAKAVQVTYDVTWPPDTPVLKAGESLTFPGGEYRTDHTTYPGLPGVLAWAAGQVVYDSLNPAMENAKLYDKYLVRLVPALLEREVDFPIDRFTENLQPASGRVDVIMNRWYFKELHAGLKTRIYYDPMTQKLGIRGFINGKTLGDDDLTASPPSIYVLQPNILTEREQKTIQEIEGADNAFKDAVVALYELSRNPQSLNDPYAVGLELHENCLAYMTDKHPKQSKYLQDMFYAWLGTHIDNETDRIIPQIAFGPGLALVPNGGLLDPNDNVFNDFTEGYITIVENNHPDMGALPVSLYVIKVVKEKVRGAIKTVYSDNVFDEKLTLRHSADFGADPDDLIFQWWYREQDGIDQPTPDLKPDKWLIFPDSTGKNGLGMSEISLAGAGAVLLVDNSFYTRYRHQNSDPDDPNSWSDWAGAANSSPELYQPQLAEGWVKRVVNGINPFEARISSFYNSESPATYVSMVRQAGPRYEGPVAFNPDKDVIENLGLIELYQTVLKRAMDLSINLEQPTCTPGITSALQLAATRISGFYNLLGNEAYNDAIDPTIGYGTDSIEYGSLAPTIFTFMNQVPSLLDEEFALLCGREEKGARPAYNRLLWNFTKGEGEVAYAMSYNLDDIDENGFIDEADGRAAYPQGHGDAWGHYLTSINCFYSLLGHPNYIWESRSEKFSVEGVVIDVDYTDERKFAETAASKAKIASEIVNITYRKHYIDDPAGQWQGYKDTDETRAWGVSGWARRTYMGSLFDWATANAIIPAEDTDPTHMGLKKIDRTTVQEILDIASQARNIQQQYDNANNGLNPLGLSTDIVPFDVNPARMNPNANAATHFEQVYERALSAMENARAVFDYANSLKDRIRQIAVSEQEFTEQVMDKDRDYRNQLIELLGTPYKGTIGAGKPYPPGYKGPDYYYYAYVDVNEVSNETVPPPSDAMKINFAPQNTLVINDQDDEGYNDLPTMFTQFFGSDLIGEVYMSTDFSGSVDITFPISAGTYSFMAPSSWGMRESPGEIQLSLIELVKAEAQLQLALSRYAGLMGEIRSKTLLLQARSDLNSEELVIGDEYAENVESLNNQMLGLRTAADIADTSADFIEEQSDAMAESLPKVAGAMAVDATSGARGAIKIAGAISGKVLRVTAYASRLKADMLESDKEIAAMDMETKLQKAGYRYDIQQALAELEGLLGNEAPTRMEIFKERESMRQVSEKYRAVLSKAMRLMEERKAYNARVAKKTQGKRYMDMAFRLNLNQSLSKYRNAFDTAARYVYLAAKAYDYDTNLRDDNTASAKPLLNEIIHQRHLGQFENGQYVVGMGGLGDILATMKINYETLKSQMGFDAPQTETGRFSLRYELMRIKHDADSLEAWRDTLKTKKVDNLWTIPEFRKFCRPFASESLGEQPGIVIKFGTNIIFGQNFFGWPLSGGDHAYDPTNFATKVRSIGVWFEGYDNSLLSETPRVYLIPTGMDVMLVPDSLELDTREWTVVDQKIPIPLPVRGSDLNNPDWIPSLDSLDGSMISIRKFSSFRAYHDAGYFDANQMNYESRQIGRSVWNTAWMLIIPGGTFHYDQELGLKLFIENVTDIKLFFQTYAISGS